MQFIFVLQLREGVGMVKKRMEINLILQEVSLLVINKLSYNNMFNMN